MKNIIFVLLLCVATLSAHACEVCGCSSGPNTIGLLPGNGYHFIGFRSQFRNTLSQHPDVFGIPGKKSMELFITNMLIGRYQLNKRIQILGFIPFSNNSQIIETTTTRSNGLGDVSVIGNYLLINKIDSVKSLYLFVSTGIKTPTGKYNRNLKQINTLSNGSGSWDIPFGLNLNLKKRKWSFVFENNFVLKSRNSSGYKFGNALINNFSTVYKVGYSKVEFLPMLGASFQSFFKDSRLGVSDIVSLNHGNLLSASFGCGFLFQKWLIQLQGGVPIYQNLGDGAVHQKITAQFSISYLIEKK